VVDRRLVERVRAGGHELGGNALIHVLDRLEHALAEVALGLAVAQLEGLVLARRRPGGHGGTALGARIEQDVDLECGGAPGIEDFAGEDGADCGHRHPVQNGARGARVESGGGRRERIDLASRAQGKLRNAGRSRQGDSAMVNPKGVEPRRTRT
jgi:hypothetical protein